MTSKTSRIRNTGGQRRVCGFRIVVDVTSQAAATTIPHHVVTMFGFFLPQVATGTQFTQQGVGGTVAKCLKVDRVIRRRGFIEYLPGNTDQPSPAVHQTVGYRRYPVGMTIAASASGIGKLARKSDQPIVCIGLGACPVVAGVAGNTVARGECMCRTEALLFRRMTMQACT